MTDDFSPPNLDTVELGASPAAQPRAKLKRLAPLSQLLTVADGRFATQNLFYTIAV
jgi:hypothetical protein